LVRYPDLDLIKQAELVAGGRGIVRGKGHPPSLYGVDAAAKQGFVYRTGVWLQICCRCSGQKSLMIDFAKVG
jgi:hypothetical protein